MCFCSILQAYISRYVRDLWQGEWDTAVDNKLHAKNPLIGEHPSAYRSMPGCFVWTEVRAVICWWAVLSVIFWVDFV